MHFYLKLARCGYDYAHLIVCVFFSVTFSAGAKQLTLQQVKVDDDEGNLKVVYPSRTDLPGNSYRVEQEC
jgi:hypothetical protein